MQKLNNYFFKWFCHKCRIYFQRHSWGHQLHHYIWNDGDILFSNLLQVMLWRSILSGYYHEIWKRKVMYYIISTFINKQILIHLQRNRQSGKLKHETSHALRICMIMHFDCENSQQLLELLITITNTQKWELRRMVMP